eukprot:5006023-Pleurochrysis_carterae.AAC.1
MAKAIALLCCGGRGSCSRRACARRALRLTPEGQRDRFVALWRERLLFATRMRPMCSQIDSRGSTRSRALPAYATAAVRACVRACVLYVRALASTFRI